MTKMVTYLKANVPENENDKKFKKEVVRTVVDMEKLTKGFSGNFVLKTAIDLFLNSFEFEYKFPMKKVRNLNRKYEIFLKF